jgi:hypothetical protein
MPSIRGESSWEYLATGRRLCHFTTLRSERCGEYWSVAYLLLLLRH